MHLGIDVYMECTITRLLKDGDRIAGAFGYWREQGRFVVFKAKSVVICTGGIGKIWKITSNSWEYTGDGMALAYDAGAELTDMEFVQFHPTGMVWPPGVQGILVTEAVRGEGGMLRNKNGERFMERYDPKRLDLSTRDVVARSIYTEVREGRGTEHGGAFLDISHKPAEYVKRKLPSMYHQFLELADVDITKGPMEVGPTCHYMMGGIRVDAETAQASIPDSSPPAKRLPGCTALIGWEAIRFPTCWYLAGERDWRRRSTPNEPEPAASIRRKSRRPNGRCSLRSSGPTGESPYTIHEDLQNMMQSLVGIFRTEEDLRRALDEIDKLKERSAGVRVEGSRLFNPGWHLARDLQCMLTIAEAVTLSALARRESRGAHSRIDCPDLDSAWGKKHNVVLKRADAMMLIESPVGEMPEDLKQVLAEDGVTK